VGGGEKREQGVLCRPLRMYASNHHNHGTERTSVVGSWSAGMLTAHGNLLGWYSWSAVASGGGIS
jgi:hypothetical protein